jgi:hypothetical protein
MFFFSVWITSDTICVILFCFVIDIFLINKCNMYVHASFSNWALSRSEVNYALLVRGQKQSATHSSMVKWTVRRKNKPLMMMHSTSFSTFASNKVGNKWYLKLRENVVWLVLSSKKKMWKIRTQWHFFSITQKLEFEGEICCKKW